MGDIAAYMVVYYLGIISATLWHYLKHRLQGDRRFINWTTMGFIAGVSAMVFVGIQNIQLSTEVQRCQREFNSTLRERAAISEDNDRLSREQRHWLSKSDEAVGDLIRRATAPEDPGIAAMTPNDPRRVAWQTGLVVTYNLRTEKYRAEIVRIEKEQEENQLKRASNQLPSPLCGAE